MKTKRTRQILAALAILGLAGSSLAAITPTSDDFSSDTSGSWLDVGSSPATIVYDSNSAYDYDVLDLIDSTGNPLDGDGITNNLAGDTEATGDGVLNDGGLRLDTQNGTVGDEAMGLTIAGTLEAGEELTFSAGLYNDNTSYTDVNMQLWNLTDGTLLAESGAIRVKNYNNATYAPVDYTLKHTALTADEGDTLQIRFRDAGTATARDVFVDNFSITSIPAPIGIVAISDNFSTATNTVPAWSVVLSPTNTTVEHDAVSAYDTVDSGDKLLNDGGLKMDTKNAIEQDEAIGLTLPGLAQTGEIITFSGGLYNDNSSGIPVYAQLWNITDNSLLAETYMSWVTQASPADFSIRYVTTANDDGDQLQIRLLEKANSTSRDIYLDNFSVTTLPPETQLLVWDFEDDSLGTLSENIATYDYTSDMAPYVGSNAVANTLAFNGGSGSTDVKIVDKGTGHEKCLGFNTLQPQGNNTGVYLQKLDFRTGNMNLTNSVRVSWSFDILGNDTNGGLVPTNWTVRVAAGNYSENINVSDAWFSGSNALAQTFNFDDDNSTWTTVTGSYEIAVNQAGSRGGIQIRQPNGVGSYTSAGGIFLDNIEIIIESMEVEYDNAYDLWAAINGLSGDDALPGTDYEPDGLNNLMEYALGGNPKVDDAATVAPTVYADTGWFYHVHNERTDDPALTFTLGTATELVGSPVWDTNDVFNVGESTESGGFKTVTNRTDMGESAKFIQLLVE